MQKDIVLQPSWPPPIQHLLWWVAGLCVRFPWTRERRGSVVWKAPWGGLWFPFRGTWKFLSDFCQKFPFGMDASCIIFGCACGSGYFIYSEWWGGLTFFFSSRGVCRPSEWVGIQVGSPMCCTALHLLHHGIYRESGDLRDAMMCWRLFLRKNSYLVTTSLFLPAKILRLIRKTW